MTAASYLRDLETMHANADKLLGEMAADIHYLSELLAENARLLRQLRCGVEPEMKATEKREKREHGRKVK